MVHLINSFLYHLEFSFFPLVIHGLCLFLESRFSLELHYGIVKYSDSLRRNSGRSYHLIFFIETSKTSVGIALRFC